MSSKSKKGGKSKDRRAHVETVKANVMTTDQFKEFSRSIYAKQKLYMSLMQLAARIKQGRRGRSKKFYKVKFVNSGKRSGGNRRKVSVTNEDIYIGSVSNIRKSALSDLQRDLKSADDKFKWTTYSATRGVLDIDEYGNATVHTKKVLVTDKDTGKTETRLRLARPAHRGRRGSSQKTSDRTVNSVGIGFLRLFAAKVAQWQRENSRSQYSMKDYEKAKEENARKHAENTSAGKGGKPKLDVDIDNIIYLRASLLAKLATDGAAARYLPSNAVTSIVKFFFTYLSGREPEMAERTHKGVTSPNYFLSTEDYQTWKRESLAIKRNKNSSDGMREILVEIEANAFFGEPVKHHTSELLSLAKPQLTDRSKVPNSEQLRATLDMVYTAYPFQEQGDGFWSFSSSKSASIASHLTVRNSSYGSYSDKQAAIEKFVAKYGDDADRNAYDYGRSILNLFIRNTSVRSMAFSHSSRKTGKKASKKQEMATKYKGYTRTGDAIRALYENAESVRIPKPVKE